MVLDEAEAITQEAAASELERRIEGLESMVLDLTTTLVHTAKESTDLDVDQLGLSYLPCMKRSEDEDTDG